MIKSERSIEEIRKELKGLGVMLPGSISVQWYVCGKKGCKCMDSENPKKHGPYYQLSYKIARKSSTLLIKEANLAQARQCIANYQRFKELNKELISANVAHVRTEGFSDEQ